MPYFIIFPAYLLLLLLGLTVASVIVWFVPRARRTSGYLVGGMIGTVPGFLIANIVITVAGLLPAWASRENFMPQWLMGPSRFFTLAVLLIGPFIASAVGVLFGFAAGIVFVFRRRRKRR